MTTFVRLSICWLVLMTMCCSIGCAGYHLGNQYLYRSDIRTVHVAMFESDSYRRFLGQRTTEAVIKEVELTTPLTITNPQIADSFIRGRIIRDTKSVVGENRFDDPRSLRVGWVVEVDWVDRAGTPLMQRQTVRSAKIRCSFPRAVNRSRRPSKKSSSVWLDKRSRKCKTLGRTLRRTEFIPFPPARKHQYEK